MAHYPTGATRITTRDLETDTGGGDHRNDMPGSGRVASSSQAEVINHGVRKIVGLPDLGAFEYAGLVVKQRENSGPGVK